MKILRGAERRYTRHHLSADGRQRLAGLISEHGPRWAAIQLGSSDTVIENLASPIGVTKADTARRIEEKLREIA
jgi:lysophospholipase L1-like esterase